MIQPLIENPTLIQYITNLFPKNSIPIMIINTNNLFGFNPPNYNNYYIGIYINSIQFYVSIKFPEQKQSYTYKDDKLHIWLVDIYNFLRRMINNEYSLGFYFFNRDILWFHENYHQIFTTYFNPFFEQCSHVNCIANLSNNRTQMNETINHYKNRKTIITEILVYVVNILYLDYILHQKSISTFNIIDLKKDHLLEREIDELLFYNSNHEIIQMSKIIQFKQKMNDYIDKLLNIFKKIPFNPTDYNLSLEKGDFLFYKLIESIGEK